MNDIVSAFLIVGEIAFLVYAVRWFARELREWKQNN